MRCEIWIECVWFMTWIPKDFSEHCNYPWSTVKGNFSQWIVTNICSWWKLYEWFKTENVTGQRYSRERDSRTNGRSSEYRVWVKFMCSSWVLFTINKYSEFLTSLVICIHATVRMWRMDFERSLWYCLEQLVFYVTLLEKNHCHFFVSLV
jgi:hypothetical protein